MANANCFGIKEVADVSFYKIDDTGKPADTPTLTFDTLKVSNLEFTSEEAFARGGKGNPKLITWDYNREATLTLQDALLSMDTLAMIFGDKDFAAGEDGSYTVNIGTDTYPGYYQIKGTTFARPYGGGDDKIFSFIINKAKISSNVTLTMEAEGDPTVFDMTITALKPSGNNDLITLKLENQPESTT